METLNIKDDLHLYNKFTNNYRMPESTNYKLFSEFSPFDIDSISKYINQYTWNGDRKELCKVLMNYADKINASDESKKNIDMLSNENTIAIVSGHQPSLLGGPLFVLLKIASVISLTNKLNRLDRKKSFVPVFWVASEDHNFFEYNSISFYDKLNDIQKFSIEGNTDKFMASDRPAFTASQIEEVFINLPQTEFLSNIKNEILSSISNNLGETFSKIINNWFKKYGLILIEPNYLRHLSKSIFVDSIKKHCKLVENMKIDSAEMQEHGYKLQLPNAKIENTFLFYIENGCRHRIQFLNNKFTINNLKIEYTLDELLLKIEQSPEKFSPTAALRPIIQGNIFPAAIYIAGGGELAYHFQLKRNFKELNVNIPLIIPRVAGTFVTPSIKKLLSKFNINYNQILSDELNWEKIQDKLISANQKLERLFLKYNSNFNELNINLSNDLINQGIVNQSEIKKETEKFISRFKNIQNRISQNNTPVGKDAKTKFFKMYKYLLPSSKYQEITISGLYFYSLLGKEFFDTICKIDVLTNDHKLWIFN